MDNDEYKAGWDAADRGEPYDAKRSTAWVDGWKDSISAGWERVTQPRGHTSGA